MNILRIFSVVVGIHVFALVLIFANPGCSSPNKSAPSPSDTVSQNDDGSSVVSRADPDANPVVIAGGNSPVSSVPSSFDPEATAAPEIRFSPTRPGTPTAAMLEAQPVGDVLPATTYTVVKGDSLWTIARKHDVSIAEIAAANHIRTDSVIRLGQKLIIPSKSSPSESPVLERVVTPAPVVRSTPVARTSGSPVVHVVRSGETLGAIARKYQVKVGEIAAANSIADPAKIRPGKELVIPGWQAPKSAQTSTSNSSAETPSAVQQAPASESTPTLVIPAPETETSAEPPVIRVEENP